MRKGIYYYKGLDVYFGVTGVGEITIFYPLYKEMDKRYSIFNNPPPLMFDEPLSRIDLKEIFEDGDFEIVGGLEEIVSIEEDEEGS